MHGFQGRMRQPRPIDGQTTNAFRCTSLARKKRASPKTRQSKTVDLSRRYSARTPGDKISELWSQNFTKDKSVRTYLEELPKRLEVQARQSAQVLLHGIRAHAHARQLDIAQPGDVFLALLGVDGLLQTGGFGQHLLGLCVLGVEGWGCREHPAEGRETGQHETVEAWQSGLRGGG